MFLNKKILKSKDTKMKRILPLIMAFCFLLLLSACKNDSPDTNENNDNSQASEAPSESNPSNENKNDSSNSNTESANGSSSTDDSTSNGSSNDNSSQESNNNTSTNNGNNNDNNNGNDNNDRHVCDFDAKREVISPTCELGGYTLLTCICGKMKETENTRPLGHSWTSWDVTLVPTQTSQGEIERTCANGHSVTKFLPKFNSYDYTIDFIRGNESQASCNSPLPVYYIYNEDIYDDATDSMKVFKFETSYTLDHKYTNQYELLSDAHYIKCDTCGYFNESAPEVHTFNENKCTICNYVITKMTYSEENYGLSVSYSANEESATVFSIYDGTDAQYIGKSVTAIKSFANNDNLISITIPASIEYIANFAFEGCDSLERVYYEGDWSDWCHIVFGEKANPMNYATEFYMLDEYGFYQKVNKIEIPDGVKYIPGYAFEGFKNIVSLNIPKSVIAFGDETKPIFSTDTAIGKIYYDADYIDWCKISIPLKLSNPMQFTNNFFMTNPSGRAYTPSQIVLTDEIDEIGRYQFFGYSALTTLEIQSSEIKIGEYAFSKCISLSEVHLLSDYTELGAYSFSGCVSLSTLYLSKNLTVSNEFAFDGCEIISSVFFNGDFSDWCKIRFKNESSNPMYSNKNRNYDSATDFYIYDEHLGYTSVESQIILLPQDVTNIGDYQFFGFAKISGIIISNETESIGKEGFAYCGNMRMLVIPKAIKQICENAITGISNLEIYYCGTYEDLCKVSVEPQNDTFKNGRIYYFSETAPSGDSEHDFWAYAQNGAIAKWRYDSSAKEWYLL